MSLSQHIPKILIAGLLVGGVGIVGNNMMSGSRDAGLVDVKMPLEFSINAIEGQKLYNKNCLACHGDNGAGSDQGPPLIHNIYNPGHHADFAFLKAVANGVQSHHWSFGNMPAQSHVKPHQTKKIIKFIREIQTQNGIRYQAHKM